MVDWDSTSTDSHSKIFFILSFVVVDFSVVAVTVDDRNIRAATYRGE